MRKLNWAKFPSRWVRPVAAPDSGDGQELPEQFPLAELQWHRHAGSGVAVILVLMALAVRLNLSHKAVAQLKDIKRPTGVAVTFDDLRDMTGLARPSISKAIDLLVAFGVVVVAKTGRSNVYELVGLEMSGGWCQLPQGWLINKDGSLKLKRMPRNRQTLDALKLYVALLTLRDNKYNTAAVSYTAITRWTGVRREEIPTALAVLAAMQLVRVSADRDIRHSLGDNSQRYSFWGLGDMQWVDEEAGPRHTELVLE